MIEVTRLNGKKYWVNPHQIESMEQNPDVTLALLSGKKIVVKESPEEIIERIVIYRKKVVDIYYNCTRLIDTRTFRDNIKTTLKLKVVF